MSVESDPRARRCFERLPERLRRRRRPSRARRRAGPDIADWKAARRRAGAAVRLLDRVDDDCLFEIAVQSPTCWTSVVPEVLRSRRARRASNFASSFGCVSPTASVARLAEREHAIPISGPSAGLTSVFQSMPCLRASLQLRQQLLPVRELRESASSVCHWPPPCRCPGQRRRARRRGRSSRSRAARRPATTPRRRRSPRAGLRGADRGYEKQARATHSTQILTPASAVVPSGCATSSTGRGPRARCRRPR